MQRRKLLTGLGMLAAGGAATVGTGAFTSAEASRSVTVTVEGDADAYLSLDALGTDDTDNNGFATQSGDGISIDINDVAGVTDPADGVGLNSVYEFDKLFQVENQGTQEIEFEIETLSGSDFGVGQGELTMEFYTGSDADDPLGGDPVTLGTGDSEDIGVKVDINDPGTDDFSAEATVSADPT
jgi:hypothetical protein